MRIESFFPFLQKDTGSKVYYFRDGEVCIADMLRTRLKSKWNWRASDIVKDKRNFGRVFTLTRHIRENGEYRQSVKKIYIFKTRKGVLPKEAIVIYEEN